MIPYLEQSWLNSRQNEYLTDLTLSKQSARSETPYANFFCRIHMGNSKPKKQDLLFLAECRTDTVPIIMRKLDLFLESNGERRYLVDSAFANSAFPSKALNNESRFESHITLVNQRDNNIQTKNNKAREMRVESIKERILGIQNRDLPAWISDNKKS